MSFGAAIHLGPYAIGAPLGSGGMGEVYRATDTRLGRTVAIKILRAAPENSTRYQRFEREARAISSLNHPHICALYDVGNENGCRYLVMECLEGETLARRLRRGPLPLSEVVQYAIEIADALDHAHGAGVVHRDLKPANLMLTRTGAKLLDFGLAQGQLDPDASSTGAIDWRETVTEEGTIVGTVQYMSPEQLEGKRADARSDLFAFGALVYEMATGRAAFDGPSKTSVMAAILTRNPEPLSMARAGIAADVTPPLLDQIVARCLAKNPDDRWQTARDLREALKWIGDSASTAAIPTKSTRDSAGRRRGEYLAWGLGVLLLALLTTVSLWRVSGTASLSPPIVRTSIVFPAGESLSRRYGNDYPLAISPDGRAVAYVAASADREQLYVRDLSQLEARPIPGTAGARHPFFSADGEWLAFFAGNVLLKVAVAGGAVQRLCELPGVSRGGSWGRNGTIVFAAGDVGLFQVDAGGGTPVKLDGTAGAQWPEILPDSKSVLFTRGNGIYATSLDGGTTRTLARVNSTVAGKGAALLGEGAIAQARVLPTGHLVYGQDPGAIRAVAIDMSSLALKGSPVSLVNDVFRASSGNAVYFAVSPSGLLVYAPEKQRRALVWVDRFGRPTPIGTDREAFRLPRVSPDGKRIAVVIDDDTRRPDVWIYDAIAGTRTRLTSAGSNLAVVWTPDGKWVTHSRDRQLVLDSADGTSPPRVLLQDRAAPLGNRALYSSSWSSDGRHLLFWTTDSITGQNLWAIQDGVPGPLLTSPANEKFGALSPDGKWIAYQSDESGRDEVFIARYPALSDKTAVSNRGGGYPVWSSVGRELFYREGTAMMAVAIDTSGRPRIAPPQLLFDDPSYVGTSGDLRFDVSADGQRFLTPKADDASTSRQLVVVHNWSAEVKRRVPGVQ